MLLKYSFLGSESVICMTDHTHMHIHTHVSITEMGTMPVVERKHKHPQNSPKTATVNLGLPDNVKCGPDV